MRKLLIATKNKGKVGEFQNLLAGLPFEIVSLTDFADVPDVVEDGTSFLENAQIKAAAYCLFENVVTLADDSGLEVDALDGAPGIYSSRYAPTEDERIEKLLDELKDVPDDKRTARFRCVIAICDPESVCCTFEGTVEGRILRERRGSNGFGYDPVFFVTEKNCGMAELSDSDKNAISHRGRALEAAREHLAKLAGQTGTEEPCRSS